MRWVLILMVIMLSAVLLYVFFGGRSTSDRQANHRDSDAAVIPSIASTERSNISRGHASSVQKPDPTDKINLSAAFPSANTTATGASLMDQPGAILSYDDLKKLTTADLVLLKQRFRELQRPGEKLGIIHAFAFIGDSEAAEMVQRMISHDLAGATLTGRDFQGVLVGFRSLGMISNRDEATLEWLLNAARAETWEGVTLWEQHEVEPLRLIIEKSMQSAGLSLKPEVLPQLEEICYDAESKGRDGYRGSVLAPAMMVQLAQQHGTDYVYRAYMDFETHMNNFSQWTENDENGKRWYKWWLEGEQIRQKNKAAAPKK